MYSVVPTSRFKKDLKSAIKRNYDMLAEKTAKDSAELVNRQIK